MTITAIDLRTEVETILVGKIGTYTGTTLPAIAVLPHATKGWDYPGTDIKVTGLEVVIKKPTPAITPSLSGSRIKKYSWEIHLKQWNTNSGLHTIVELLVDRLSEKFVLSIANIPRSAIVAIEQCKIYILDFN